MFSPSRLSGSALAGGVGSRSPRLPSHGGPFGFAMSGDEKEMSFVHGREGGAGAGKTAMGHEQGLCVPQDQHPCQG